VIRFLLPFVVVYSAAFAALVFVQSAIGPGYGRESRSVTNYRGLYELKFAARAISRERQFYRGALTDEERRNVEDFRVFGRDWSRVGGADSALTPRIDGWMAASKIIMEAVRPQPALQNFKLASIYGATSSRPQEG
jgi:hypothetical protein